MATHVLGDPKTCCLMVAFCLHCPCVFAQRQRHYFFLCLCMSVQQQSVTFTSYPTFRWKGGRSIKLEGSDHAPVLTRLLGIPDIAHHSTPTLSARYIPMIRGLQQTLGTIIFLIFWAFCFVFVCVCTCVVVVIIRYVHFIQLIMSSLTSGSEKFCAILSFEEASGHFLG